MNPRLFVACAGIATVAVTAPLSTAAQMPNSGVVINLDSAPPPAQPKSAPAPAPTTAPAPSPVTTAPTSAAKDAGPKQKAPGKIKGVPVKRDGGGFLGVEIVDGTFRISFYDEHKKPIVPDVSSIALRWPVQYQPNDEHASLFPDASGKYMTSEKIVRPPYSFKLYITLLKATSPDEGPSAKTYVIDFRQ